MPPPPGPEEALPHFQEAVRIWTTSSGADHPDNIYGLIGVAQAHLDKGTPREGIPLTRRALALVAANEMDPAMRGEIYFLAAKVIVHDEIEGARNEARELAELALQDYRESQRPSQEQLDEIERWLAALDGP